MRIYDGRLGRFLSVDPLTKDYPSWSPYPYAMNRPIDGVDLDGGEWKPVIEKGIVTNFVWAGKEESYDAKGKLKAGYYEAAILFKDHGTWTKGKYSEKKDRWESYNMGSATATVYGVTGPEDIEEFQSSTLPSDPEKFATIQAGLYQAVHHKHQGKYPALQLRKEENVNDYQIPTIGQNPAYSNRDYAEGINIHKAGSENYTGSFWKDGTYSGVSEGCLPVNIYEWDVFIGKFDNANKIGVIIDRGYRNSSTTSEDSKQSNKESDWQIVKKGVKEIFKNLGKMIKEGIDKL